MKICIRYLTVMILFLVINAGSINAQDWNEINPGGVEILTDTTLLRSVIVTIDPGETIGPVTHPAHFAYILSDGKLSVSFANKEEPVIMDLNKGMSLYNTPQGPHKTENIGDQPVSFMLVELKEHPYK